MNNKITVDPNKLFTKSSYSKEYGIDRVTLDKRIRENNIKTISFNGVVLVKAE